MRATLKSDGKPRGRQKEKRKDEDDEDRSALAPRWSLFFVSSVRAMAAPRDGGGAAAAAEEEEKATPFLGSKIGGREGHAM